MFRFRKLIGSTLLTLGVTKDGDYCVQIDKESLSLTRYSYLSRLRTAATILATNNGKQFMLMHDFLRLVLSSTNEDGQLLIHMLLTEGLESFYEERLKLEIYPIVGISLTKYYNLTQSNK